MPRARVVLLLAAIGGAGTMVVELAAVRLLAPWFGASQAVWTNVIGVILAALSLGYLTGARASRGAEPLRAMGWALLVAGVLAGLLPFLAGPIAELFLPEQVALEDAVSLVAWGSLATSSCLFLAPAWVLGMIAPLAVETLQRLRGTGAGDSGGRVLASSTLGSIAGVFLTTHVLIPELGSTRTFAAAAFALTGAGAAALLAGGGTRAAALFILLPVGAWWGGGRAGAPDAPDGWELLAAAESPYQSVRVREDQRGGPQALMRHLQVNEAFDSFQSVWQPEPGLLPEGFYYNLFALPLHWSVARGASRPRTLVLGLGAGTAWRVLEGVTPDGAEAILEGVELDPVVVALAREHMDLAVDDDRHRTLAGLDARLALRVEREPIDLCILDCYANQIEIPPHLATVEFLREVRARLAPKGWLAMNVGGFGFEDPLVQALAQTTAAAFEHPVLLVRVPASRNFIVFASRDGWLPIERDRLTVPAELPAALFAPLSLPGAIRVVEPGEGAPLTDDHAPLEGLQRAALRFAEQRKVREAL